MDLFYASYAGEMSGPIVHQLCWGDEWTYCMPVMRGRNKEDLKMKFHGLFHT